MVDTDGRPVPDGEVGNAQVRGPSLFVGYARNGAPQPPDLTADGFLPTGDLATINDDGTINIRGREKQIIIRGGRNIDINEVEASVAAIPGVAQVCVVPVPDDLLGERLPHSSSSPAPSWVSTRCASSSGRRTSRSSSGRSSCTPYLRSRRTGLGSSTAAMRSRWRHSSPRPKPDAIVLAEAPSQVS